MHSNTCAHTVRPGSLDLAHAERRFASPRGEERRRALRGPGEHEVELASPRRRRGRRVGRERGAVEELQGRILAAEADRTAMWGLGKREDVAGLGLGPWIEHVQACEGYC
jgi:hypothetical protein